MEVWRLYQSRIRSDTLHVDTAGSPAYCCGHSGHASPIRTRGTIVRKSTLLLLLAAAAAAGRTPRIPARLP